MRGAGVSLRTSIRKTKDAAVSRLDVNRLKEQMEKRRLQWEEQVPLRGQVRRGDLPLTTETQSTHSFTPRIYPLIPETLSANGVSGRISALRMQ